MLYPQHPGDEYIIPWIANFPLFTPDDINTLAEICGSNAELATDLRFWSYPSQPAQDTSTAYLGTSYTVYNTSHTPQKEGDLTRRIVDWYPPQVHHIGVDTTASGSARPFSQSFVPNAAPTSPLLYPRHPVTDHMAPRSSEFPVFTPNDFICLAEMCVSNPELASSLMIWPCFCLYQGEVKTKNESGLEEKNGRSKGYLGSSE